MKKRILSIFLVIILAVTSMPVALADNYGGISNVNINTYDQYLNSSFTEVNDASADETVVDKIFDGASGILKTIVNIINGIIAGIISVILWIMFLIFPNMEHIVFNDSNNLWSLLLRLSYFDAAPGGMAGEMVAMVSTIYQLFRHIAIIFFVIAIACIAVKMIISSVGKNKQKYKESLRYWFLGLVLLVVGHWIMIYSIYFCDYLVSILANIKSEVITNVSGNVLDGDGLQVQGKTLNQAFSIAVSSNLISAPAGSAAGVATGKIATLASKVSTSITGKLGWAGLIIWGIMALIAILVYISMNMKIFKIYLERVIVVGVLIMIFPIVTVFFVFEKAGLRRGTTFENWLKTFIEQVFIQPVHAISLFFIIIALNALADTGVIAIPLVGMIVVLMVLNMVFTIENVVKRIISIGGASLGQPGNAMAAAATVGMGINAGLAARNLKMRVNSLPKLEKPVQAKFKNEDGSDNTVGYKEALAKYNSVQANRSALINGTVRDWSIGAMGRSPLHIDGKLFNSNLSQGERIRVERTTKSMATKGKIELDRINDVVALLKDRNMEERVQIFTKLGLNNPNMSAEEFGKLASSNEPNAQDKFLLGCALLTDSNFEISKFINADGSINGGNDINIGKELKSYYHDDSRNDVLKEIIRVGGAGTDGKLDAAQLNAVAAALSKSSDKMESIANTLKVDNLISSLSSLSSDIQQGIAAALLGNGKVEKIFYEPGKVDLSYVTAPATKEQASAIVQNIQMDYNVTNDNPLANSNIMNVISAAAGYRERLTPGVVNQIAESVGSGLSTKFEEFIKTGDANIAGIDANMINNIMTKLEEVSSNKSGIDEEMVNNVMKKLDASIAADSKKDGVE